MESREEKLALVFLNNMPITEDEWVNVWDDYFEKMLINRKSKDVYRLAYTHGQTMGCPEIDGKVTSEQLAYLNKGKTIIAGGIIPGYNRNLIKEPIADIDGIKQMGWFYDNIEADFFSNTNSVFI